MTAAPVARTIWLHIGTEKTGTSTIQTACLWNKEILASAGVLYPEAPILVGARTHAGLVHFAAEGKDQNRMPHFRGPPPSPAEIADTRATLMGRLQSEIEASGCHTVLLSSEHLSSSLRQPASVVRLIGALRELAPDVRVLLYLRPQYQVYPSAYSTQVKGGSNRPGRPPAREKNKFYNYDLMTQLWEGGAGREHLEVRLFDRARFKNGDLIDDFFDAIGMPTGAEFRRAEVSRNRALDADSMEFLRLANGMKPDDAEGADWHGLVKRLEDGSERNGLAVPAEILERIDRLYRESNDQVAKRYFPELTNGLFKPFEAPETESASTLTVMKAVNIAVRLWLQSSSQLRSERAKNGKRSAKKRGSAEASLKN